MKLYQLNILAFKCPYCDRRYTQNADLNKHLRTHVGQNTYKCSRCDKSFRLLYDLRRHVCENFQQQPSGENINTNAVLNPL